MVLGVSLARSIDGLEEGRQAGRPTEIEQGYSCGEGFAFLPALPNPLLGNTGVAHALVTY